MKKILNYSFIFLIVIATVNSCSDLDENYSHYLKDIKYSSRVRELSGEIGIEKVRLSWINPEDHVAKRIRIEYGNDMFIETESLISSITIEDLTSAVGYSFSVFTLDAFGNKSIGSTIFLTPVTQTYINSYVDRLTTIQPKFSMQDNILFIKWENLTENAFLWYTGKINYTYSVDDETYTGSSDTGNNNEETVIIPDIHSPINITFDYVMYYQPIIGNNLLIDTIPKSESAEIVIDYSSGDIFEKIEGSKISRYFGIPYDNTTEFSSYYLFAHLFDGSSSDNSSWVSSSPDVDPLKGGNKENDSQYPLSFTVDISDEKELSHIEIWGWENFSQAPKRFEVWGTLSIEPDKPQSYWETINPGDWQDDWYKLADCEVVGNPTPPGYKFEINPNREKIRFVRILVHEVFKPVNHVRVGMSELMFYEQLPPRLIVK